MDFHVADSCKLFERGVLRPDRLTNPTTGGGARFAGRPATRALRQHLALDGIDAGFVDPAYSEGSVTPQTSAPALPAQPEAYSVSLLRGGRDRASARRAAPLIAIDRLAIDMRLHGSPKLRFIALPPTNAASLRIRALLLPVSSMIAMGPMLRFNERPKSRARSAPRKWRPCSPRCMRCVSSNMLEVS